jgi:hypothetical protein
VVKLKESELEDDFDSESNPEGGKQIIDVEPSATLSTTKVWPSEPEEPEEWECLFHAHMWVKGICFISLSIEVVRRNSFQKRSSSSWTGQRNCTCNPKPSIGFSKEEIFVSANNAFFPMTSSLSNMRYCVIFLPLKFVMLL